MSKGGKRILLAAAIALLAIAVIWRIAIEVNSPVRSVCQCINRFGYNISPDDLLLNGYGEQMDLRELFSGEEYSEADLALLTEVSQKCGFDADLEVSGKLEQLLYNIDNDRVMIIYTVDCVPELVFIEKLSSGEVLPIG